MFGCFGGMRRSRDADVSPSSLDVEVDGHQPPELLKAPSGMRLLDHRQETEEGWKVPVEFTTTTGDDRGEIICDLNKPSRAIRRQPAIPRPFSSPFTTAPVSVWVVCAEEIIGEKISALLRRRNGRLRDIYDICPLFGLADQISLDVVIVRAITIEALQDLIPLDNLRADIREAVLTRVNGQVLGGDASGRPRWWVWVLAPPDSPFAWAIAGICLALGIAATVAGSRVVLVSRSARTHGTD